MVKKKPKIGALPTPNMPKLAWYKVNGAQEKMLSIFSLLCANIQSATLVDSSLLAFLDNASKCLTVFRDIVE